MLVEVVKFAFNSIWGDELKLNKEGVDSVFKILLYQYCYFKKVVEHGGIAQW